MPAERMLGLAAAVLLALLPLTAAARDAAVGRYRAADGPDVAAMLELAADGHFRYQRSEGAVDEWAEGVWRRDPEGHIRLQTQPRPKPPEFTVAGMTADPGEPLTIHVSWPDGQGIAAVDFRIGMDSGNPIEGYTQHYGWSRDVPDGRRPVWVELSEPFYGTASPRFPVAGNRNVLRFILHPNDMGVADFDDTLATMEGDRLILHRRDRLHRFRAVTKQD